MAEIRKTHILESGSWESTMVLLKVLDLGSDPTIYLELCPATFASAVYFCT